MLVMSSRAKAKMLFGTGDRSSIVALFALDMDRVEGLGAIFLIAWAKLSATREKTEQLTSHRELRIAPERTKSA